jgi:hypothetical protein
LYVWNNNKSLWLFYFFALAIEVTNIIPSWYNGIYW